MNKFVTAMVAAVLLAPVAASPAMADPGHDRGQHKGWYKNGHHGAWRNGERFDRRYATNYQVVDYHRYRGLRAPPRGYHWVRSGNDAVLVAVTTGIIASVIAGTFR